MKIRTATLDDCRTVEALIEASARELGQHDYSAAEIEAALRGPWGLDTQLIDDGTYFIVEAAGDVVACGGWSFRKTLFGSDSEGSRDNAALDPAVDAARIRAFFVHPAFARRGIGTLLLEHCEAAAMTAGFRRASLGATLPGQRLYQRHGFVAEAPITYDLGAGLSMQVIPMTKTLKSTDLF